MPQPTVIKDYPSASVFRSFGAILYDAFLIAAIEMLVLLLLGLVKMYAPELYAQTPEFIRMLIMLFAAALFYVWCWTHGGKTLGMQAWKMEIRQFDGRTISAKQAWLRVIFSCFGLGNLSKLIDKNNLGWHDHLSKTVAVVDKDKTLSQN